MNCPKCSAVNRLGSKFCTSCGFSFNETQNFSKGENCNNCNSTLKPGTKFCTSCGTPVKNTATPVIEFNPPPKQKPLSVIKDRIFWNVQKGEVAHRFNETEMMQYDNAKGIIINEGTTAYIRANGVHVAEIKGGAYDFVEPQKLDETLNQRQGGIASGLRAGFRFLSNLVMGRRVKDTIQSNETAQNLDTPTTMASLIEGMKKDKVFSVTLKLDKSFPLVFEVKDIETSILNATFGIHAFFKIDDFAKFSEYYLSDSDSASFEGIQKEFEPIIKATIQEIVYDHEIKEGRLPEDLLQKIKAKIESAAADFMYGLKLEKIVEVSSKSEDLARYRELSRELYLSEKELEYLARSNEFRNRLTLSQNTQRLAEARTDADFHRALTVINNSSTQERLLSDDEMDKFYMVLSREKRIREAKNEDEINSALIEIEKTGLLRTEDLENLKRSIRDRSEDQDLQRFHSVALLQINQSIEIDRKKLEWEFEIGDKRIDLDISRRRKELQAEIGYSQLEIERWKTEDDYKDSVFYKDLQKRKAAQIQDIDIRKANDDADHQDMLKRLDLQRIQFENEARVKAQKHEQEIAARAQELSHLKDLKDLDNKGKENLVKVYQGMTFEQIMAANPDLTPEAAASLAKKYESEAEAEKFKIAQLQNDTRAQDMKEMMDRMERMSHKVIDSSTSKNQELTDLKDQQKDEYKQRLERQEIRMDNTQDKALDYTTRNNSFGNVNIGSNTAPPPPPSYFFVNLPGQQSVPRNLEALINMVKSGEIVELTSVFSPTLNSWVAASSIDGLKPYFPPVTETAKIKGKQCQHCGFSLLGEEARFCPECGNEP
jgi:hypothetical protein